MNKNNWITYPERHSCYSFAKEYILHKPVKTAVINITAMGWYNLYVCSSRVDDTAFAPGWTDYDKRVQFQTYDVTQLIKNSLCLKVDLGEGWGGTDHFGMFTNALGAPWCYWPASLNFEIDIEYVDGSRDVFVSDSSVDVYTNEVLFSNIYDGETQDYRVKPKLIGKAKKIDIFAEIIPQEGEDIIFGERFPAKDMWKDPAGNWLIDFGQNFTGIVEINIKGKEGDKISYTPGEILDKDGVFYNENYRSAKSLYSFVLSGKQEILKPKFSFLGGRYIKLIEAPDYVCKENFTAVFVHSKLKRTGWFECGNQKIQRLYLNSVYGQLSNYLDVPTDCPQRDERLGWTADAHVFAPTGAIHFDIEKFMTKWLRDMALDQESGGEINNVIPKLHHVTFGISSAWADAATIIPWDMYLAYGDTNKLLEFLPMMEKWTKFLTTKYKKPYLPETDFSFGDWLALDKIQENGCSGQTRFDLVTSAFFCNGIQNIINVKKVLKIDTKSDEELLKNAKEAYQNEFIKNGHMVGHKVHLFDPENRTAYSQTGIVLTIQYNLCKEKDRHSLISDLVELIHECGNKMSTGFLGTPFILHVLSENGHADLAYDLLFEEGYPSWLYSVNRGATTMWEHYDGIRDDGSIWFKDMNSFNHYAYGSVFKWIFNNSVGINLIEPQYKEIFIRPRPDKRLGYVNTTFTSRSGDIKVSWKYEDENVHYVISVATGIKAKISLQNHEEIILEDGGNIDLTVSI